MKAQDEEGYFTGSRGWEWVALTWTIVFILLGVALLIISYIEIKQIKQKIETYKKEIKNLENSIR